MSGPASSSKQRWIVVVALLLSVFMSAMEATVVGTAMPTVIAELGGLLLYGWVGSSYLLASTVSMPLYGKLADLYGRRPVMLVGISLFLVGSIGSGFARSIEMLIALRALQGLGAGAIQPITFTILGDLFSLEERGRVQAFFGAIWAMSGAFGPILGGLIVASLSWRWVFWINVPFGVGAMIVLTLAYHEGRASKRVSLDWLGAVLLTSGSISLLIAAQRTWPWLFAPLALALLTLFVLVERRAAEPVVPLDMVRDRAVSVASLSAIALGATMSTAVTFLPLEVQGVMGGSATDAGSTLAPMLLAWPVASAITSRTITRVGFRAPVILGSVVCALGLGALPWAAATAAPDQGLWPLRLAMAAVGMGMGFANTALLLAVQTSVEASRRGVATALQLFSRSVGGALGVGALGALFSAVVGSTLSEESVASLLDPHARASAVSDPGVVAALSSGLVPLFEVLAALGAINAILVLFYPRAAHHTASTVHVEPSHGE
ncbi:MAG: MFS transporter [Sandaracinaceae bacterium]|nr:MFS transporter [Sandaracinaceae bacterium]